ncbi:MAG: RNA-directed DNA polymerase [Planctomycetes bacterium]|nr:RNA-directed DNA polymerase [Planctomycetota bacterium]
MTVLVSIGLAAIVIAFTALIMALSALDRSGAPRSRPLPGARVFPQAGGNIAKLRDLNLPELDSTHDLLRWLRLELVQLLPLANHANRTERSNYVEWAVPKKSGGLRVIAAPKKRLKAIQLRILREILDNVPPSSAAHGFVRGRDVLSNATPHVGKTLVVNFDLVDFFGHIAYPRVVGVFRRIGYGKEVSRWLACLCTHQPKPPRGRGHDREGRRRHAVQGAPSSPAIANLAAWRLDARLCGLARRFQCTYTRYADDLTFSGDEPFKRSLRRFLPLVRRIVAAERFALHRRKMRFARASRRQEVTGVVVNRKTNIRRADFDRLKAILHNARRAGSLESQNREQRPHFRAYLLGLAAHVAHLNPQRGERLRREILALE